MRLATEEMKINSIRKNLSNNNGHRIESAAAAFQKGVYHLFLLQEKYSSDSYDTVLRTYQSVFQLCLAHFLLDFETCIDVKLPARLKKFCADSSNPRSDEIDPAATVTHSEFETGKWKGIRSDLPLGPPSKAALSLISRVGEARHNLIYRPFLLQNEGMFWEDCTLLDLLDDVPSPEEILDVYRQFFSAVLACRQYEIDERKSLIAEGAANLPRLFPPSSPRWADYFVQLQFWPFRDRRGVRPAETILLGYARMLNPTNDSLFVELLAFRNGLLDLTSIEASIDFDPSWRPGQV